MKYTLGLIALTFALAGCVKAPIEGRNDPFVAAQVHFTDKDLRNHTAVGVPILTRDESGDLLHAAVPLRTATNRQLFVDYRVTFFDKNRQQLSQTNWMPKVLAPNVPDQIVFNSMGPRAADFQMDLRYSK